MLDEDLQRLRREHEADPSPENLRRLASGLVRSGRSCEIPSLLPSPEVLASALGSHPVGRAVVPDGVVRGLEAFALPEEFGGHVCLRSRCIRPPSEAELAQHRFREPAEGDFFIWIASGVEIRIELTRHSLWEPRHDYDTLGDWNTYDTILVVLAKEFSESAIAVHYQTFHDYYSRLEEYRPRYDTLLREVARAAPCVFVDSRGAREDFSATRPC